MYDMHNKNQLEISPPATFKIIDNLYKNNHTSIVRMVEKIYETKGGSRKVEGER